jgi:hypothetical protein
MSISHQALPKEKPRKEVLLVGECFLYDTWKVSLAVFVEHFTSFGFKCVSVESLEDLCNSPRRGILAVTEFDEEHDEIMQRIKGINAKFKICVGALRSPNEVRTVPGIDAIVSRHIKRDSLRNIVNQLVTSGNATQPSSRQTP